MASLIPRLFIGSSSESLPAAEIVAQSLRPRIEVIVWPKIFLPSDFTLEALVREADRADLALLVFTPDDRLHIRKRRLEAVRDNVIFEFGLFVGRLGRRAAFYLAPSSTGRMRIPTDLNGLNAFTYDSTRFAKDANKSLAGAAATIKRHVSQLVLGSPRLKTYSGRWKQSWKVVGSRNFGEANTSVAHVLHIDRRFRAQFRSGKATYVADGVVEGHTITGVWRDVAAGGIYHGAFELSVVRNGAGLVGQWIGHREDRREVAAGSWVWNRDA